MATKRKTTMTPKQREAARAAREAKVEAMQADLAAGVAALADSDQWRRWLDFLGSFHTYSVNNALLIQIQCPHASQVAGFRAWQGKGRQVRKGETGIKIFGKPFRKVTEEDEQTGEKVSKWIKCPPPVATVFDISQTDPIEGVEQPTAPVAQLQGDDPAELFERIRAHMTAQGWTIEREQIPGDTNGYCVVDGSRRIVVDADLSAAHAAKTMIHEAAHALLHTDDDGKATKDQDSATREVEAESVAYVVAGTHGLDTGDYSFGYVAGWAGGDTAAIKATAARVQAAAHTLLDAISGEPEAAAPQTTEPVAA